MLRQKVLEFEEKRRFARAEVSCRLSYRLAGDEARSDGTCVNISGGGVQFHGHRPLDPGRAVELRIDPEGGATPTLVAYVEVLRCEPAAEGGYRIAGAIKGITTR